MDNKVHVKLKKPINTNIKKSFPYLFFKFIFKNPSYLLKYCIIKRNQDRLYIHNIYSQTNEHSYLR